MPMTTAIIITLCILLLIAYLFDISASKTKIPSVILLLILGWSFKLLTQIFEVNVVNLNPVLPVLGTIGLILIVLEGSLELEINRNKFGLIKKSSIVALVPILLLSGIFAYIIHYFDGSPLKNALGNVIPLFVISSAIAIPSVKSLSNSKKEFVTYESSLSDIFGVIFFNFITLNETISTSSFGHFFLDIFLMLVISLVASLGLSFLLSRLKHHVKFVPIILMIVLVYAISKHFHLPSLIFILILGLFLGNLDELQTLRFIQILKPQILNEELHKFKEIIAEIAFIIRALFFLLFGFLIESTELLNLNTIAWAVGIVFAIFGSRIIILKIFSIERETLWAIAPRGLITILLFLSIPVNQTIPLVNKSLLIQVIILSALVMMFGLMKSKNNFEE